MMERHIFVFSENVEKDAMYLMEWAEKHGFFVELIKTQQTTYRSAMLDSAGYTNATYHPAKWQIVVMDTITEEYFGPYPIDHDAIANKERVYRTLRENPASTVLLVEADVEAGTIKTEQLATWEYELFNNCAAVTCSHE